MNIAMVILLLSATAAQGQGSAPSSDKDFGAYGRGAAENAMTEFAQCVVRGTPAKVADALKTRPGSPEETASFMAIANGRKGCLHQGKLRMKGHAMRGALAEQLYLHRFTAPLVEPANPAAPAPAVLEGENSYHAAGCIVARNAPAVDSLIRYKAGSEEERGAFQRAMPALSSCLAGGENNRLRIDRAVLRGYLAEALLDFRNAGSG